MALAWARKKDTPYVEDPVFVANFLSDFSAELGVEPFLTLDEVDFGPCYAQVAAEKEARAGMTKDGRKALAAQRRALREDLKAELGYAIVNGQRVELGTYMVEPSGIFMGRGRHPLRGRWKEGAQQTDITLNLSPDAPIPAGSWDEIVWEPESLWVARWRDKLTGKMKYIWLSDTAPVKQKRDAVKFDQAIDLGKQLDLVRARIWESLSATDPRRRMIATACYLIDYLCLRVGDEKDEDEADTVGATTLRPEHVRVVGDSAVEFRFLGKDSVEWHKTIDLPSTVLENLSELVREARPPNADSAGDTVNPSRDLPQLFPDVTSSHVNSFLSDILPGLTAKVFRTYHATRAVRETLCASKVGVDSPEYAKWRAASLANLEAARLCNHTKPTRSDARKAKERYQQRRRSAEERLERYRQQIRELQETQAALTQESRDKVAQASTRDSQRKTRQKYRKRLATAQRRLASAKDRRARTQTALGKLKAQFEISGKKREWNLTTSLKSYIDPRVYHAWGNRVGYDVIERYYPATLRRKYAWVRAQDDPGLAEAARAEIDVRSCMPSDLPDVVHLFSLLRKTYPSMELPEAAGAIRERYLPDLGKSWREALVALQGERGIIAFMAVGPEWLRGDLPMLNVFAAVHPACLDQEVVGILANEVSRRVQAYQVHHPKRRFHLCPTDASWCAYAPGFAAALGLIIGERGEQRASEA